MFQHGSSNPVLDVLQTIVFLLKNPFLTGIWTQNLLKNILLSPCSKFCVISPNFLFKGCCSNLAFKPRFELRTSWKKFYQAPALTSELSTKILCSDVTAQNQLLKMYHSDSFNSKMCRPSTVLFKLKMSPKIKNKKVSAFVNLASVFFY